MHINEFSELPKMFKIKKIVSDNPSSKTFILDGKLEAKPGQFVMVWIPGVNEKPFGVVETDPLAIGVYIAGPFSKKMHELTEGDSVGIRGPYGNGFDLIGKGVLLVAGGCGVYPLRLLAKEAQKKKMKVDVVVGAGTKDKLISCAFGEVISTDDGSKGRKGFSTVLAEELMEKNKYDCVYACGPEKMLFALFQICEKRRIPCQLSLERYMKCGFGICDQCSVSGLRVCKEGPVFSSEQLRKLREFGKFARNASGKLEAL